MKELTKLERKIRIYTGLTMIPIILFFLLIINIFYDIKLFLSNPIRLYSSLIFITLIGVLIIGKYYEKKFNKNK